MAFLEPLCPVYPIVDSEANQIDFQHVNIVPEIPLSGNSVYVSEQVQVVNELESSVVNVLNQTPSKEMSGACPNPPFLVQSNASPHNLPSPSSNNLGLQRSA